jgi:hypothetical protein
MARSLGVTQQDATSPIAGAFIYSPAAGWIPKVGTHTLTVTFTPSDKLDYKIVTATVALTVKPATRAQGIMSVSSIFART